mgnify:CR=1 FL=1
MAFNYAIDDGVFDEGKKYTVDGPTGPVTDLNTSGVATLAGGWAPITEPRLKKGLKQGMAGQRRDPSIDDIVYPAFR